MCVNVCTCVLVCVCVCVCGGGGGVRACVLACLFTFLRVNSYFDIVAMVETQACAANCPMRVERMTPTRPNNSCYAQNKPTPLYKALDAR